MLGFAGVFLCLSLVNVVIFFVGDRQRQNYVKSPTSVDPDDGTAGGTGDVDDVELTYKKDDTIHARPEAREPTKVMNQFRISNAERKNMVAMKKQESLSLGFDHNDLDEHDLR